MEDVSCEQRAGDDYNWHSSMPAALKSIVLSKSFCSRPAQPCLAKWKKLKLDSNFRIENWHRGRAGQRWTELWRCIVWSPGHQISSDQVRRLTNQRPALWHLTNQKRWYWSHLTTIASTIGSKKVLNPFWTIIPLLSAGHVDYHWPHLRPHYRREQWIMFSVISPPCLCSGNVFICENSWDHDNCLIMQSIVKSVSGPQFLVSSLLSPFLQPPLPPGPHLIPCPSHRRHQEGQHVMLILKQETKGGEPNHFIIFLLYIFAKSLLFMKWGSAMV